jgi:hypothetical protein
VSCSGWKLDATWLNGIGLTPYAGNITVSPSGRPPLIR